MDLWATRKASLDLLYSDLVEQRIIIEKAFKIIDESIDFFNKHAKDDQYSRICGLTLAKARSYALGAYGMILDNLGQEAGALMRPFLEYYELLIYFSVDPARVEQAVDDNLPSAGKRAKLINSDFKGFREYLNRNASHSSYSFHSSRHQIDVDSLSIKITQLFAPTVLFRNLGDFFFQLILLCFQAAICISVKEYQAGYELSQQIGRLRDDGGESFKLKERLDAGYEPQKP